MKQAESRFRTVDQTTHAASNRIIAGKNHMRRFGFFLALRLPVRYGRSAAIAGCGSSVVEHSLGKGEVESSILSRSTSLFRNLLHRARLTTFWRQPIAMSRLQGLVPEWFWRHNSPAASTGATKTQTDCAQLLTCDSRRPASSGGSAMPSSAKRNMSSKSRSCSKTTPPTLIASTSLSPFGAK